jgi:tRNA-dihydrouridine synthase
MKNDAVQKKLSSLGLKTLPKPFFVLAPMDDVTDTVFRQVIAATAPPDLYFTEFVNVDALQNKGREATLPRLQFTSNEQPLVAQLWGLNPENFYKTAQQLADGTLVDEANYLRANSGNPLSIGLADQKGVARPGFAGVDLNFGCPDKNVVRNGACSAFILPENREAALEIIQATREGAASLPLSVKTRLGFNEIDYTWHELLLKQKLNMLTIHGRTKKQMSDVPADWDKIADIRELRDRLSPATLIIGNGDVLTRQQGLELAEKHGIDGIMIGRGIFHDPYVFAQDSPWQGFDKKQRINLYRKHVELFARTWQNNERKIHTLNKFCKVYINGFDGAKELREELMAVRSSDELLRILTAAMSTS